jgi:hypothetical protein
VKTPQEVFGAWDVTDPVLQLAMARETNAGRLQQVVLQETRAPQPAR